MAHPRMKRISVGVAICMAVPLACASDDGAQVQPGADAAHDRCGEVASLCGDVATAGGTGEPTARRMKRARPDRPRGHTRIHRRTARSPRQRGRKCASARYGRPAGTRIAAIEAAPSTPRPTRGRWATRGTRPDASPSSGDADSPTAHSRQGRASGSKRTRLVAYVNTLCGFGIGPDNGTCLDDPDPNQNHILVWECARKSPITHYVLSFLSFKGAEIQTDPGPIWANGGGSTTDFALHTNLRQAMQVARAAGAKIMLSLGGELGSNGFLSWWTAQGAQPGARLHDALWIDSMVRAFAAQNALTPRDRRRHRARRRVRPGPTSTSQPRDLSTRCPRISW